MQEQLRFYFLFVVQFKKKQQNRSKCRKITFDFIAIQSFHSAQLT